MTIAAILLAAHPLSPSGTAAALVPWDDNAVLVEYVIHQIRAAGVRDIEVVLGFEAQSIVPYVAGDNIEPVINDDWRSGIASSLRVGATAVPRGTTAAVVIRVDEPRDSAFIAALLVERASTGAPLTRPSYDGRPGTPIVVSAPVLAEMRNLRDDAAFDALIGRYAALTAYVPGDTDIALARVTSAEDAQRLRSHLGG